MPGFAEILAFFVEAKSRLAAPGMDLATFNRQANGHILGEGPIKDLPDAFLLLRGNVDGCVSKMLGLQLSGL